ncbi:MAG: HAD-IA family hydrolase [Gammaproteobacteria bacterium]|jgi:phosphoglycolate phosphatase|nr:HAD-IA family hydrolase [Gammaproteobacteria bacterium]MBU0772671.1 HAD-IA family hydrolase [Gammaproteobacteria bacterium]MBU0856876.1 HAD-IA family hydrolase [Gammaproteobacteria bacterium]MBU1846402.1 HAD-IA family hydrolase [Gammaproteobacteria bacterium]
MFDLNRIHAIAFDLDGTLVDSAPDIWNALNTALENSCLPGVDLATTRSWIGGGPDLLIRRALVHLKREDGDGSLHATLRAAFDRATLDAPLDHGMVFDGIEEMVEGLYAVCPLVVVTNKPTPLAQAVLAAAGLLPFMSSVHGADTAAQTKPSPALLDAAAAQLCVKPAQLLMVGDSAADLLAARNAGCPVALVGWGYGAHGVPDDVRPWHIASPSQLLMEMTSRYEEAE